MDNLASVELIVAMFGALVTVIQVLGLFILTDIRKRVARLEDLRMKELHD